MAKIMPINFVKIFYKSKDYSMVVLRFCFKNTPRVILLTLILAGIFCSAIYVFAVPPTTKYDIGETDNPSCVYGSANCDVVAPAQYSFGINNFSGTGTITAGAITGSSFTIGSNTVSDFTILKALSNLVNSSGVLTNNGSGVLSWATISAGVSFGTTTQIPYMNAGGTDFLYGGLTYDGATLLSTQSADNTTYGFRLNTDLKSKIYYGQSLDIQILANSYDSVGGIIGSVINIVDQNSYTAGSTVSNFGLQASYTGTGTRANTITQNYGLSFNSAVTTTYSKAGAQRADNYGTKAQIINNATINKASGNITFNDYLSYGEISSTLINTAGPGANIQNIYGLYLTGVPQAVAGITSNYYGLYNNVTGAGTSNYFIYNLKLADNLMGIDNSKSYFGTGLDASIYYDGTNLNINPKEVGTGYLSVLGYESISDETNGYQIDGLRALTVKGATGSENLFLGQSGNFTTTGINNIFAGYQAGLADVASVDNVAIGYQSLKGNTYGRKNIAIGSQALYAQSYANGNAAYDTENVAVGYRALYSNQPTVGGTGNLNTAIGNGSLYSNTIGFGNTATGYLALYSNTIGANNTANGLETLYFNTEGSNNIANGLSALYSNTTGSNNTANGVSAGYTNSTGSGDVFLGYKAGYYETGSNKLFIDNQQRASEADARTKALIYGVFDAATANQKLTINASIRMGALVTGAGGAVAVYRDTNGDLADSTSSIKYKTNVTTMENVLDKINQLNVVRFSWNDITSTPGMADFGMISEEVNTILPDLVTFEADGTTPRGLKYEKMGLFALKGLQEQQEQIKELKNKLNLVMGPDGSSGDGLINGVDLSNPFVLRIKNILAGFGINVGDKAGQIKTVRIERMEMVDSATGDIYCTWIENGEWKKVQSFCDSLNSPAETPPAETPPAETPPAETPPAETPPAETPPAETPPAETPPAETPPAETPPAETPPAETPPAETPPAETPPADN